MIYQLLLLIGILLTVTGQLLLKKGILKHNNFRATDLPKLLRNKPVMTGVILYGTSLLLWLVVLSKLELSYAYPLFSLNYFFIALFSKWVFHERVSKKRWASILTIILGVITVSLS